MKEKVMKLGADGIVRVARPVARLGARLRKCSACLLVFAFLFLASFGALAQTGTDANVTAVDNAAGTLQTTFATIFAVGVAVVVALICRKYLRRAS